MTEDLSQRVQNAANGVKHETLPDQRRHFLGSLRERVYLKLSNQEILNKDLQDIFMKHLDDYQPYHLLINGNDSTHPFVSLVMKEASQHDIQFTLVNNENALTGADEPAILVVSNEAINRPRIALTQVYPPEFPTEKLAEPKKVGFWKKLFGKD
ncbi:MAG: YueI family protein [Lactobacillus sp.]|nr:YueI family protein [Lactobacillus sp.]